MMCGHTAIYRNITTHIIFMTNNSSCIINKIKLIINIIIMTIHNNNHALI